MTSVISSMYRGDTMSSSRWWEEEMGQKEAMDKTKNKTNVKAAPIDIFI